MTPTTMALESTRLMLPINHHLNTEGIEMNKDKLRALEAIERNKELRKKIADLRSEAFRLKAMIVQLKKPSMARYRPK